MNRTDTSRASLISYALEFIRFTVQLPGVTRIALFGSLTTDKVDPKDADILVAVTDDADLAPLAKAARRLQGRAQSLNRGGEVFLIDCHGTYLGRICPWRNCGPGYRLSCDALHCGRRPYLHDDLDAIQLSKTLIEAPPIDIWPKYIERVRVPRDLKQAMDTEMNIGSNRALPTENRM
jgi:predicted nucleotidyltransferase